MNLALSTTDLKPSAAEESARGAVRCHAAPARTLPKASAVTEADLLAAQVGHGVTRIAAHPDRLMPAVCGLGEVMALTRNDSVVHERTGSYDAWHPGDHAAMILGPEIDLRIFPSHWVHGFAVRNESGKGPRHAACRSFLTRAAKRCTRSTPARARTLLHGIGRSPI